MAFVQAKDEVKVVADLRQSFIDQHFRAAFRVHGLKVNERLFNILKKVPMVRFLHGRQSASLKESIFHQIETCGEAMSKMLTEQARVLFMQHIELFQAHTNDFAQRMKNFNSKHERMSTYSRSSQSAAQKAAVKKEKSPVVEVDMKQRELEIKEKMTQHMQNIINEEGLCMEDLKRMLHSLNDIRVLMNSVFAREYIFECLQQDLSLTNHHKAIGIDLIRGFLQSVVTILIETMSPSGVSHLN